MADRKPTSLPITLYQNGAPTLISRAVSKLPPDVEPGVDPHNNLFGLRRSAVGELLRGVGLLGPGGAQALQCFQRAREPGAFRSRVLEEAVEGFLDLGREPKATIGRVFQNAPLHEPFSIAGFDSIFNMLQVEAHRMILESIGARLE